MVWAMVWGMGDARRGAAAAAAHSKRLLLTHKRHPALRVTLSLQVGSLERALLMCNECGDGFGRGNGLVRRRRLLCRDGSGIQAVV